MSPKCFLGVFSGWACQNPSCRYVCTCVCESICVQMHMHMCVYVLMCAYVHACLCVFEDTFDIICGLFIESIWSTL